MTPDIEMWTSTGVVGAQRILPDGCLDVILDLQAPDRLLVAGPDTVARVMESTVRRPLVAVRLHAGRGAARLGVPADALADQLVPLEQMWGDRRARRLVAAVAADPAGPGAGLCGWARGGVADPTGLALRELLVARRSVAEAADTLGYSRRQLQRRALALFGYGPQHLARILRLLHAVDDSDGGLDWATSAARAGYADQAHLARDVRALTGVTPTALRRERVRSVQDAA